MARGRRLRRRRRGGGARPRRPRRAAAAAGRGRDGRGTRPRARGCGGRRPQAALGGGSRVGLPDAAQASRARRKGARRGRAGGGRRRASSPARHPQAQPRGGTGHPTGREAEELVWGGAQRREHAAARPATTARGQQQSEGRAASFASAGRRSSAHSSPRPPSGRRGRCRRVARHRFRRQLEREAASESAKVFRRRRGDGPVRAGRRGGADACPRRALRGDSLLPRCHRRRAATSLCGTLRTAALPAPVPVAGRADGCGVQALRPAAGRHRRQRAARRRARGAPDPPPRARAYRTRHLLRGPPRYGARERDRGPRLTATSRY
mmetsp:Transcript_11380/g.36382  ORF Transcript_11380/g.36382 Transcript_11380/m.36382 type:complete len:322 (-) Transcript_11380:171-1136(-)